MHPQQADGIVLPDHVTLTSTDGTSSQTYSDNENKDIGWRRGDDRHSDSSPSFLYAFELALTEALAELGGQAVPKMNWSVPRDAAWYVGGGIVLMADSLCFFVTQTLLFKQDSCQWPVFP